jgi:hypothetical protein
VTINEGQSQAFSITASDLYGDPLTYSWKLNGSVVGSAASYTYTSGYSSAGTYTVLANVSDGVYFVTRSWQLIVNNVNRAPVINSYSPTSLTPSVNEGSSLAFSVTASDPDSDPLTYSWKLDGTQVSTSSSYTYSPWYTNSGSHAVTVTVSDGSLTATKAWAVAVNDVHTVNINLYTGNNNVQLPARPADTAVTAVLSSVAGKYNSARLYDSSIACNEAVVCANLTASDCQIACDGLRWLVYNPNPLRPSTLHYLDGTLPFGIYMNQDAVLTVNII